MKKIILLLFIGALTFNVSAQSNSVTAGLGLLNTKIRVQLEHGFGDICIQLVQILVIYGKLERTKIGRFL